MILLPQNFMSKLKVCNSKEFILKNWKIDFDSKYNDINWAIAIQFQSHSALVKNIILRMIL